ncbi:hypothetical protein DH2020_041992 [Rehmannia glutinosa]|uniref:Protein kinase domain-containing protein n=1 Tax=Rehmannia glutinosa TaxID=99300 RepID=A0ABR0UQ33_REHGL
MDLSATIPPQFGNLSFLVSLDMSNNKFHGDLPQEFAKLRRLKYLNLRENQLSGSVPANFFNISTLEKVDFTNNNLSGNLPANMCRHSQNLEYFSVYSNLLSGEIPQSIGECSRLQTLLLQFNQFTGPVPKQIGNLSMLVDLYLGDNNFKGEIPGEIGELRNLEYLTLDEVGLRGPISSFIYNISTLQWLYLGQNNLTGDLPMEICLYLPAIQGLYLGQNQMTGSIPKQLGNCSSLVELYLDANMFTGQIPGTIFNMSTLRTLSVRENRIIGNLPSTMGQHLPNLGAILLGQNNLTGPIPDSISNASSLTRLSLVANKLTGHIPNSLGKLEFLHFLNLGENDFTSESSDMSFLTSLTNCRSLGTMWIQNNSFSGYLPNSIGNFSSSLEQIDASNSGIKGELTLSKNKLYGPVPACLSNITALRYLNLDSNELNSSISPSIGGLRDLLRFNVFSNFLSGQIPGEIGNLRVVTSIDLSSNELSGGIPSTITGMNNLINLSLSHNRLQGPIPDLLGNIISLERLDLSHNNLTGSIPKSMEELQHLEYLNISFNKLTGEIPNGGPFGHFNYQSFISNDALCGSPRLSVHACRSDNHHKRLKTLLRVLLIPLAIVSTVFALTASVFLIKRRRKNKVPTQIDLLRTVMLDRISYRDVEIATDRFSESNLLGIGSFGSVYKGVFSDGTVVAVKVFNLQIEGAFKSFDTECEVLRNIRHRNLTKVVSSCTNLDFRALILEYMPNGSLEKLLYSQNEVLNLQQRLSIMIDVASAIDYLHYGYGTPIVHCDLKPSNVLLDESMVAHVSDFGIAKLVNAEDSEVQTKTLATFGYIAPEFGSEGLVSTRCDVYSFGIMLMETFTRKRPTDDLFTGGLSLRSWINDSYPHSLIHLVDATLIEPQEESLEKKVDCITLIMKLALDCSVELPGERTNMKDALATLQKIRKQFF